MVIFMFLLWLKHTASILVHTLEYIVSLSEEWAFGTNRTELWNETKNTGTYCRKNFLLYPLRDLN